MLDKIKLSSRKNFSLNSSDIYLGNLNNEIFNICNTFSSKRNSNWNAFNSKSLKKGTIIENYFPNFIKAIRVPSSL